ncbi:MAG: hypothetical protein ACK4NF_03865 [Planctomycetota bacterium]
MKLLFDRNTPFLLLLLLLAQFFSIHSQENNEKDIKQFLENIKLTLQKFKELNAKETKYDRRAKEKRKKEIRKKLIERLTLPYVSSHKHFIIDYKKQQLNFSSKKIDLNQQNDTGNQPFEVQVLKSNLNKILKENRALIPFKLPDLASFLKNNSKAQVSNNITSQSQPSGYQDSQSATSILGSDSLRGWYLEIVRNLLGFWTFVIKMFNNEKRFAYLKHRLCRGEIENSLTSHSQLFLLNSPLITSPDNVASLKIYFPLFSPLNTTETFYTISNNVHFTNCSAVADKYRNGSVCTNLALLSQFGYCKIHKGSDYFELLYQYITAKNISPTKLKPAIRKLYNGASRYFAFARQIYKNLLLPTFFDMCYIKCLCTDEGIPCTHTLQVDNSPTALISLLVYKSAYQEMLKNVEDLYQSLNDTFLTYAQVNQCDNFVTTLNESLNKNKQNIVNILQKYVTEIPARDMYNFYQNYFVAFFNKLSSSVNILDEIVKSQDFITFIKQYDELKNNLSDVHEKCKFLLFSFIAKIRKNRDALNFLISNNKTQMLFLFQLDESYIYSLLDLQYKTSQEIEGINISEIIEKDIEKMLTILSLLKYDIFTYLSVLQLNRCFNYILPPLIRSADASKIDRIEQIERLLKKFKCIFDTPEQNTDCLLTNEFFKKLVKEIVMARSSLLDMRSIILENEDSYLYELSQTLRGYCLNKNLDRCNNFYREGYFSINEDTGGISSDEWGRAVEYFCVREGAEKISGLDDIKEFCPDFKILPCEQVSATQPQICEDSNSRLMQNAQCTTEATGRCNKIYSYLSKAWRTALLDRPRENLELAGQKYKIEKDKFCRFLYENMFDCCSFISAVEADAVEKRLEIFFILPSMCLLKVNTIALAFQDPLYSLVDEILIKSREYLKDLYTKYANGNLCE